MFELKTLLVGDGSSLALQTPAPKARISLTALAARVFERIGSAADYPLGGRHHPPIDEVTLRLWYLSRF